MELSRTGHVHSTHAALRVRVRELRAPVRTAARDERRRAGLPDLRVRARDAPDLDVRGLHVERRLPELRAVGWRVRMRRQLHVRRSLTSGTRWRSAPPRRQTSTSSRTRRHARSTPRPCSAGRSARNGSRSASAGTSCTTTARTCAMAGSGMAADGAGIAVWIPPEDREEYETIGPAPPGDEDAILGDHADHHAAFWGWVGEHEPQEPLSYLSHIGVAPERQGEGIGTALMHDGLAQRGQAPASPRGWRRPRPRTRRTTSASASGRWSTRTPPTAARTSGSCAAIRSDPPFTEGSPPRRCANDRAVVASADRTTRRRLP